MKRIITLSLLALLILPVPLSAQDRRCVPGEPCGVPLPEIETPTGSSTGSSAPVSTTGSCRGPYAVDVRFDEDGLPQPVGRLTDRAPSASAFFARFCDGSASRTPTSIEFFVRLINVEDVDVRFGNAVPWNANRIQTLARVPILNRRQARACSAIASGSRCYEDLTVETEAGTSISIRLYLQGVTLLAADALDGGERTASIVFDGDRPAWHEVREDGDLRSRVFFNAASQPTVLRSRTQAVTDTDELRLYLWNPAGTRSAMFVFNETQSLDAVWQLRERSLWTVDGDYEMSIFNPFHAISSATDMTAYFLSADNDLGFALVEAVSPTEPVLPRSLVEASEADPEEGEADEDPSLTGEPNSDAPATEGTER